MCDIASVSEQGIHSQTQGIGDMEQYFETRAYRAQYGEQSDCFECGQCVDCARTREITWREQALDQWIANEQAIMDRDRVVMAMARFPEQLDRWVD